MRTTSGCVTSLAVTSWLALIAGCGQGEKDVLSGTNRSGGSVCIDSPSQGALAQDAPDSWGEVPDAGIIASDPKRALALFRSGRSELVSGPGRDALSGCRLVPVAIQGFLSVLADLPSAEGAGGAGVLVRLKELSGKLWTLHGVSGARHGQWVSARGVSADCGGADAAIESLEPLSAAGSAPLTAGARKALILWVQFADTTTTYSAAQVRQVAIDQVDQYWQEVSYGQVSLSGDVVGPLTLSLQSSACDVDTVASQSEALARAQGVDPLAYDHLVYVFNRNSACGTWLGLGTIGGWPTQSWINGSLNLHTVAHELGHGLGLYHSNALLCGSSTLAANCGVREYGDTADVMGNLVPGHYNGYQKDLLGWFPPSGIQTVSQDGSYSLSPYESADVTLGPKVLRVMRSRDPATGEKTYYYLEYRQPLGVDDVLGRLSAPNNLTRGVLVHLGSEGDPNTSWMLNLRPSQSSFYLAALEPGQPYQDWGAQISIQLVSAGASSAQLSITVGDGSGAPSTCH